MSHDTGGRVLPGSGARPPRLLLLGGTGEALRLARACAELPVRLVYSVAGLTAAPELPCEVRTGGFGGETGLLAYLEQNRIQLVMDATHPYAATISRHALRAARSVGCPAWALQRPPWRPGREDDWCGAGNWKEVVGQISSYATVLFTIGRGPLSHAADRPEGQRWIVRSLQTPPVVRGIEALTARGPFSLDDEFELFTRLGVEVLVSKNSGGAAVAAKLQVARTLRVPVVMLERPSLPRRDREFGDTEAALAALREWLPGVPA